MLDIFDARSFRLSFAFICLNALSRTPHFYDGSGSRAKVARADDWCPRGQGCSSQRKEMCHIFFEAKWSPGADYHDMILYIHTYITLRYVTLHYIYTTLHYRHTYDNTYDDITYKNAGGYNTGQSFFEHFFVMKSSIRLRWEIFSCRVQVIFDVRADPEAGVRHAT